MNCKPTLGRNFNVIKKLKAGTKMMQIQNKWFLFIFSLAPVIGYGSGVTDPIVRVSR